MGGDEGPLYLVWLQAPGDYHLTPGELAGRFVFEEVRSTSAGTVYEVRTAT